MAFARGPRPVEEILRATVRSRDTPRATPGLCQAATSAAQDALLRGSTYHRVAPGVHLLLQGCDSVPDAVRSALARLYQGHLALHLLSTQVSQQLSERLDSAGIGHVFLKGPALAEEFYRRPDLRMYTDLDVMVPPGQAEQTYRLLVAAGAAPVAGTWQDALDARLAQVSLRLPEGPIVDLHWHLFSLPEFRERFPVATEELIDRRRKVRLTRLSLPVLALEDGLLHLCAHTSFSGGNRLIWFNDIAAVVERSNPDWDVFIAEARKARLQLVAAGMLERTRQITGVDIPDPAIDSLAARNGWRRVLTWAEQVRPIARTASGQLTGELLVLATRDSTRSSVSLLAHLGWSSVAKPLLSDPDHPWRRRGREHRAASAAPGLPKS